MRASLGIGYAAAVAALALNPAVARAQGRPAVAAAAADSCPWVHSTAPAAERAAQVLSAMTLDEKIQLVHGAHGTAYAGWVPGIPRLCVPALKLHDGPGGVADGLPGVTQLPAPVAVAATWDTAVARAYGAVIADEEWAKGANVNLGPTVNIVRDPRWGRAFEALGEDPLLSGRIAAAEIRGVQGGGVLSQVKHWVAYNQETFRNTAADDVIVDRRTLHEIYMPQFEAAVAAGAASAMCSYATVNGTWACENAYTQDTVLNGQWRFGGFITSDWGATHSTVASILGGLAMQMPESTYFGAPLEAAVQAGQVPVSALDDKVRRILEQEFRFHLFERQQTGVPTAVVTTAQDAAVARSVAEAGTVLLKNAGGVLPLNAAAVHSIAVIGYDAGTGAMSGGGGSAAVVMPYLVTPFQGLARRAGSGVTVQYAQGTLQPNGPLPAVPAKYLAPASGTGPGLTVEFYNNMTLAGPAVFTRVDSTIAVDWHDRSPGPGVNANQWSARWTGTIAAPATGTYIVSLTSDDGSRLFINGVRIIDNWRNQAPTTEIATVTLTAGQSVPIEVDFYQDGGGDSISLGWRAPGEPSLLDAAVTLARSSDVAVVFASDFETEGADLPNIDLPGEQDRLIAAVAAANPRTIVVLNTGSAVAMPWVDSVAAVVEAWYPGQEDGNAIAAVLYGDVDPSAKLPVSFPRSLADVPASTSEQWPGVAGQVRYSEGLLVGYRWYEARALAPLFPFGFGLSYTTFRFSHLRVTRGRGAVRVTATVTNTGRRAGAEVAQVYVGAPAATGEPPWQLEGFARVELEPGRAKDVTFDLGPRAFAQWDTAAEGWVVGAGRYRIGVGSSSANLPLLGQVAMRAAHLGAGIVAGR